MKRIITTTFISLLSLSSMAQRALSITDGFYRVQNFKTGRYAFICDNTGGLVAQNNDVDMGAIALFPTLEVDPQYGRNRFVDPASVCYVEVVSNYKHDIMSQGTGFFDIIEHYVMVQDGPKKGTYCITPYIDHQNTYNFFDDNFYNKADVSWVNAANNTTRNDEHCWNFKPLDFSSADGEYLAIAPKAEMKAANGKYYVPYVVGFPMSFEGEGMKAYYVKEVKADAVLIKEIESEVIPAKTPIIVECTSINPLDNRVKLYAPSDERFSGNRLIGQFFCYSNHGTTAYKEYKKATMRVLAVNAEGQLIFTNDIDVADNVHTTQLEFSKGTKTYDVQCLPSNSVYLTETSTDAIVSKPVMTVRDYRLKNYTKSSESNIVTKIKRNDPYLADYDFNDDGRLSIADVVIYLDYKLNQK